MKLVIFAILGLLIGVGGGAAMSVMKAKKAFAAYDAKRAKVVADSIELGIRHTATDSGHVTADSTHATPDSAHAPVVASTGAPAADHGAPAPATKPADAHAAPAAEAKHETPAPAGRQRATATVEAHGGTTPRGKPSVPRPVPTLPAPVAAPGSDKMGKIFGAMPAKDAAKVLEQLSDSEVHDILRALTDKQAAGILQFLPPARAASISKLALKGGHE